MTQSRYKETAEEILATVRSKGHKITRAQLTRWHVFGLVPRPMQLRRQGMRGSETVYPIGTIEQVIAVTELLRYRRNFDDVKIELWRLGYEVSPAFIANELRSAVSPPFTLEARLGKVVGKGRRQVENALGGDGAGASMLEYSDDELYRLRDREAVSVLSHAEHLIPRGYIAAWYDRVRFVALWLLASKLPSEQQRIAVAEIMLQFVASASPVPGLAPTLPRGRPPRRGQPAPRRTRAVA